MFDDILGPREQEVKPYLGEKKAEAGPASVGGVGSPDGMDPNKKNTVPPSIGGLKGRPVPAPQGPPVNSNKAVDPIDPDDDLWDEDDCDCEEECDDCGCGNTGCLQDNDVWSTNPCAEVELP